MKFSKTMVSLLLAVSAAIWLIGCGGGGDTTITPTTTTDATTTLSGTVADGYLVGAKVCLDKNYNDTCDADEPFAITDATGRYTFVLKEMTATQLPLIVEANASTVDLDTNMAIGQAWHFKAAVGSGNFISPLTTLVARDMDLNSSLTLTQAMINLQNDLGLDINTSVDYVASKNIQAHNAAKILAHSLAVAETNLTEAALINTDAKLIRLLAAKQIRAQTAEIKAAADANNTNYLCTVDTDNVDGQIMELSAALDLAASSLSEQLQADLLFMWEEEKLARDVYLAMYEKWGSTIFITIANNSEQSHMDSVKAMIDKYNVNVGDRTEERGVFVNTDLQTLYNILIAKGNVSVIEAYKVGVLIEITDIEDLDIRLQAEGLPADIRTVYEALRTGSENHLAAFNKQLL